MNESEIKSKLDQLAEFHAQRSKVETEKAALLEDTKVPEYVQAIVKTGAQRLAEVENERDPELTKLMQAENAAIEAVNAEEKSGLDAITIPEEIKAQLAAIDEQRAKVREAAAQARFASRNYTEEQRAKIHTAAQAKREAIQAEIDAQTKSVFDAIEARKHEIEAEFSGKTEAADANIKALEAEIKAAVKEIGFTVKGNVFRAEYGKGRKSWLTDHLEAFEKSHPELKECYTVGDPSVAIKRI